MSQPSETKPAPRRYGPLLLIAAFVLVNVLVFGRLAWFWYLSEPSRQITIGPETTYLHGPLTPDGYIDYIGALNQRQSEGVTPANNAVTLLVQAYGADVIGQDLHARYFEQLGVPSPMPATQTLVKEFEFVGRPSGDQADSGAVQRFTEQTALLRTRPWTRAEFPDGAAMLDKNAAPLAQIVDASRRDRFYSPLLSTGPVPSMFTVLLPIEQEQREAARQLTLRAMLRLGEGDPAGAWDDLLACHRLARLTGQSPFLISALVSFAIDAIASEADQALIASPQLTAEQARTCLADLQRLPPLPSIVDALDRTERLGLLDVTTLVARGNAQSLLEGDAAQSLQPAMTGAIEWDRTLEVINDQVDALVAAAREPDIATRAGKLAEQEQIVEAHNPLVVSLGMRSFLGNREAASRDMGWVLVRHFLPAIRQSAVAQTRADSRERLLLAGFALAAYQRDRGEYPESLTALVPGLLSEVPIDPWSGKELLYRKTGSGFVVYSVGENLTDDGGVQTDWQPGPAQGDTVLRVGDQ